MTEELPFWKRKTLEEMTPDEWESLCDGCARCCAFRLRNDETGELFVTEVACSLLNLQTLRCTDYPNRSRLMPTCLTLDPDLVQRLDWMPDTCAYRLLANGQDLPWWHPLVSGDPETVHSAGISVRGKVILEKDLPPGDTLEDHVVGEAAARVPRRKSWKGRATRRPGAA